MRPKKQPHKLSEAEFKRVFNEVRRDINELQLHDQVFSGTVETLTKYPQIANNFRSFFTAFYSAIRTDLIIRLGRIYDPEGTGRESCTLARCLESIRDNPEFFTDEAITSRLSEAYRKSNPKFLTFHHPDLKQIEKDLGQIIKSRKPLINLRHKMYAHKDLETVIFGKQDVFLSKHEEVKELIKLAHEIWNRYSQIWDASTYSTMIIYGDDYKWLFTSLRRGMKVKSVLDNRKTKRWLKRAEQINEQMKKTTS
jgi:hypothetical protein